MNARPGSASIDLRAAASVWRRDAAVFRKIWKGALMPSFFDPLLYLFALGFGLGTYIARINGIPYREFIAPGLLASSAMYAASFESTYNVFLKLRFHRIYEAIVATPVEPADVVLGELAWAATRSVIYGSVFLLVVAALGLASSPLALLMIPVLFVGGFCFAVIGMGFSGLIVSIDFYSYYFTLFITPMFLLSGIFFPLSRLPGVAQVIAWFTPLFHLVRLSRSLVSGTHLATAPVDFVWLCVCSLVLVIVPMRAFRRQLIK